MNFVYPEHVVKIHNNERDIEVPSLFASVLDLKKELCPAYISLLDVGAHYSWYAYAGTLRQILRRDEYHAVDILEDSTTARVVDEYYVNNVCDLSLSSHRYDFVSCISTLEHCGISTYKKENPGIERERVVRELFNCCRHRLFLSFPFGQAGTYPGEYENITDEELAYWESFLGGKGEIAFYYNPFPQGGEKYSLISRDEASRVSLDMSKGVQCVCLAEFTWNV